MTIDELQKQIDEWERQQKVLEADHNKLAGAIAAYKMLQAKIKEGQQSANDSAENVVESEY